MKRSEINAVMRDADNFIRQHGFLLPPFAYWSPSEWRSKGNEVREIVDNQLGWDVTDFGMGRYEQDGLFLFTVRNGSQAELRAGKGRLYCEKLMVVGVNQITPMHTHWTKVEDIINRGGGKLAIQLYNATDDDKLADTPIVLSMDGVKRTFQPGEILQLAPGESVTFPPRVFHKFWGAENRVLVGEVSLVNDDHTDNCFYEPVGRFPAIEEDTEPLHLLVGDYSRYWKPN